MSDFNPISLAKLLWLSNITTDRTTGHPTDETTSQSTKPSKNDGKVAGYKLSECDSQIAGYRLRLAVPECVFFVDCSPPPCLPSK
jgi:hypothetical protein